MSTNEVVLGLMFLSTTLQGDSTLASLAPGGVWRGTADPTTSTPYVIVSFMSGTDALTATGVRPMSHLRFQVKAVGPASNTSAVANAAAQVDSLLGGNQGLRNQSVTGGFIGTCYRDGMLMVDSLVSGEKWVDIGGFYILDIEQTT
jgi:Protein of unknown function (DUF3168)